MGTAMMESVYKIYLAAAVLSYLIGSIPFGLILTKMAGAGDIRKIGSGNIGATNVLRTGKKGLAALTLLLDGGKGALAVLIIPAILKSNSYIFNWYTLVDCVSLQGKGLGACPDSVWYPWVPTVLLIAGFFSVLGHLFPVWLKFKGGKGVATTLGVLLAACWPAGLIACGTWLLTAFVTRYSSLSALVALALAPLPAWYFGGGPVAVMAALLAVLVWWKHEANIKRLLAGTEPKIGKKKPAG